MNKTQTIRNERIEHHLNLVDPIAGHYARRSGIDRDDLKQVGRLGLLRAAEGYEQGQEKPFEVYAKLNRWASSNRRGPANSRFWH